MNNPKDLIQDLREIHGEQRSVFSHLVNIKMSLHKHSINIRNTKIASFAETYMKYTILVDYIGYSEEYEREFWFYDGKTFYELQCDDEKFENEDNPHILRTYVTIDQIGELFRKFICTSNSRILQSIKDVLQSTGKWDAVFKYIINRSKTIIARENKRMYSISVLNGSQEVDETGLDPEEIQVVMDQACCNRNKAVKSLRRNPNIVDAILYATY